jgi:hypothetical protein
MDGAAAVGACGSVSRFAHWLLLLHGLLPGNARSRIKSGRLVTATPSAKARKPCMWVGEAAPGARCGPLVVLAEHAGLGACRKQWQAGLNGHTERAGRHESVGEVMLWAWEREPTSMEMGEVGHVE